MHVFLTIRLFRAIIIITFSVVRSIYLTILYNAHLSQKVAARYIQMVYITRNFIEFSRNLKYSFFFNWTYLPAKSFANFIINSKLVLNSIVIIAFNESFVLFIFTKQIKTL